MTLPAPVRACLYFAAFGLLASLGWVGGVCAAARGIPFAHLFGTLGAMTLVLSAVQLSRHARGWLGAVCFGLGTLPVLGMVYSFLWQTTAVGFVPVLLYLAAFPAVFVWCAARVMKRWPRVWMCAYVPVLWAGLEVLRGEVLLGGFSWLLIGHAFTRDGGPGLLASVVGQYGVGLVLMLIVSGVLDVAGRGRVGGASKFNVVVGMVVILVMAAMLALAPPTRRPVETVRVAVVQTNLPQSNKLAWPVTDRWRSHVNWLGLTAFAGRVPPAAEVSADAIETPVDGVAAPTPALRPGLIVWPETMFPGDALNPEAVEVQRSADLHYNLPGGQTLAATAFADALTKQQLGVGVPMLVGSIAADGLRYWQEDGRVRSEAKAWYNSVLLVRDGSVQPKRYDKIDLMPFGEYIPLAWRSAAAQRFVADLGGTGMAFNLSTGSVARTFELPFTTSAGRSIKLRLGTPICFEVAYDRSCRRLVVDESGARRVDFLVNVSNDGWFHNSRVGRELFLLSARWRAAELGTPILRAANTGISCVIDANGSVLHRRLDSDKDAIFSEGVMTAEMPFAQVGLPVYASIGPMLLLLMGFGGVGVVVLGVVAGPWPRVRWRRGKKV